MKEKSRKMFDPPPLSPMLYAKLIIRNEDRGGGGDVFLEERQIVCKCFVKNQGIGLENLTRIVGGGVDQRDSPWAQMLI